MSVDYLKNFSLDDVRKARLDFTSSGTTIFGECIPDLLGDRYIVLQPDKIRYGDKSTTGSPISSHRGSSVHHDSSGSSSSGSPIASPFSYTRDLVGVDSPGLSGGTGAITPVKKEESSPMVPRQVAVVKPETGLLQPRAVMLAAEPSPQPPPPPPPPLLPPRKSRFDVKPEDMEVDEKPKQPSLLSNGKRKATSESEEEKSSKSDEDEVVDPRRAGSLGSFVKRIKLETLSTTVTKPAELKPPQPPKAIVSPLAAAPEVKQQRPAAPPLLPRVVTTAAAAAKLPPPPPPTPKQSPVKTVEKKKEEEEESSEEDEDETDVPAFGPQLPKTNGISKTAVNGVVKPLSRANSESSLTTSAATTGAAGSVAKAAAGRKRLLSERGEKELKYPVMEKEISSKWGWDGASWLNDRKRGQGLINRANDCFLNAILQTVTHTAPLARYLMERHKSDCKRDQNQCVACALRQFHLSRTFTTSGPMDTRWIASHLKRIFPSHAFGMQEDAHELLSLLLDAIDPPPGWNREQGNKELPTNKLKPSTPIEQIFGGTLRNQVTCQSCTTPYINYERIRELNVALGRKTEERIPLSGLVQDYFKNETISAFSCKKCARKTQAVRQTRVLRAPAVLIVQLKRFNAYGSKIRQPIFSERDLDLSKFMFDGGAASHEGETGGKRAAYVLTGVVEHLGATVDHGHYIAYCRSTDNQTWFKFDDEEVSRLSSQTSNPYLLFYSRKDLQPKLKNGMTNGVTSSTTSMPSTSKLVSNGNGVGPSHNGHMNGGEMARPIPSGGGMARPIPSGGGFGKPYQNGPYQKPYGNGYGGGNKYNGYSKHQQQFNKWSNQGNGQRPIKTFNKSYNWSNHQRI